MIYAIMAMDNQGGISKNGVMPWPKNSEDLQFFKRMTQKKIIVMGSSTWNAEDMPSPLPNRVNVVATGNPSDYPKAHSTIPFPGKTIEESIRLYEASEYNEGVFIIGGAKLIESTLHMIDIFYITMIEGNYECDTFAPLNRIQNEMKLTGTTPGNSCHYFRYER